MSGCIPFVGKDEWDESGAEDEADTRSPVLWVPSVWLGGLRMVELLEALKGGSTANDGCRCCGEIEIGWLMGVAPSCKAQKNTFLSLIAYENFPSSSSIPLDFPRKGESCHPLHLASNKVYKLCIPRLNTAISFKDHIMAAELSRTAGGSWNPSEHEFARSVDGVGGGKESILRHGSTVPSRNRQRSASCPSMPMGQPRSSLSPLVSWDDSAFKNKSHITRTSLFDNPQDSQSADYQCENSEKAMHGIALSAEEDQLRKDQVQMGVTIRRTENINVFDGSSSETYLSSGPASPTESGSRVDFVEKRLLHPDDYFQELDDLGSKILENSSFNVYKVSSRVVHKTDKIAE